MKKLAAILLTLMLLLGMSAAYAEEITTPPTTVTLKKVYQLIGNGRSPAETFTLEVLGDGEVIDGDAASAPALGTITGAHFDLDGAKGGDGGEAYFSIKLPAYTRVGKYEYHLREAFETATSTAGVDYYPYPIKMIVTVTNEGEGLKATAAFYRGLPDGTGYEKTDKITNTYSAGTLKVKKTVNGNLGDKDKKFDFTVTFTNPVESLSSGDYVLVWNPDIGLPEGATRVQGDAIAYTFQLADGEEVEFTNLPKGVGYTVTETAVEGYTTTVGDVETNEAKGTIKAAETSVAAFTNTKEGTIDTGVTTESLPYVVLMAFVVLAGAALLIKRKAAHR